MVDTQITRQMGDNTQSRHEWLRYTTKQARDRRLKLGTSTPRQKKRMFETQPHGTRDAKRLILKTNHGKKKYDRYTQSQ